MFILFVWLACSESWSVLTGDVFQYSLFSSNEYNLSIFWNVSARRRSGKGSLHYTWHTLLTWLRPLLIHSQNYVLSMCQSSDVSMLQVPIEFGWHVENDDKAILYYVWTEYLNLKSSIDLIVSVRIYSGY